jgi:hypothetical protein
VSSILQKLKTEGSLRLYLDFRSESCADLSGNNVLTNLNGGYLGYQGFSSLVAGQQVVAVVPGFGTTATVITGCSARSPIGGIIRRLFTTSTYTDGVGFNGTNQVIWNDPGTKVLYAGSLQSKQTLGFQFVKDVAPLLYSNGQGLATGAGVSLFDFTAGQNWYLCTRSTGTLPLTGTMPYFLIISRVLTATEHADLYAELEAMRWPTDDYRGTVTRERPTGAEPGLVWAPNLVDPAAHGVMADLSPTGADATVASTLGTAPTYQMDNVGPGYRFHGTPYLEATGTSFTARSGFTAIAVVRPNTVTGAQYFLGQYARWGIGLSGATVRFMTYTIKSYDATGFTAGIGKPIYIACVMKADYSVDICINGVFNNNVAHNAPALAGSGSFCLGRIHSSIAPCNSTIYRAEIYNRELSAAEIYQNYQATGLTRTGFETSWGVPCLGAAVGGAVGLNVSTLIRTTATTGTHTVTTSTIEGEPVKVYQAAGAAIQSLIPAYTSAHVGADNLYGSWTYWLYHADASNSDVIFAATAPLVANGIYRLRITSAEVVQLIYSAASNVAMTAANFVNPLRWYRYRIVRDYTGYFRVWVKPEYGAEVLALSTPSVSATTTVAPLLMFSLGAGDKISLGGLVPGYGIEHRLFCA